MLYYIISGLALGSIYAIASTSLVLTFESAGILNFSFGAVAYVVARFYYWLNTQHRWGTDTAGALSLLVFAPLLGVLLYALLFRHLRGKSTLVKLVATIGLFVMLPAVADFFFGTDSITSAPGLASPTDTSIKVFGTPVTSDQLIIYGFLIFVLVAGTALLRFTNVGLKVRAMVDSEAMTSLSGTHPGRVALGVWAVTTAVAGLAGILVAPSQGLDAPHMTLFMSVCFAPVIIARLRSLPIAVVASLLMGVVTDVIQKYLPANSSLTAGLIESIPFGFIVLFLLWRLIVAGSVREDAREGGPLDRAIKPAHQDETNVTTVVATGWRQAIGMTPLFVIALLPLVLRGSAYWLGLVTAGLALGLVFLTFTVVTGESGMLWLSQIVFAGVGALGGAWFAHHWGIPVLLAVVVAAVIAAAAGALVGFLTIRLGDLYVSLVTLTFASLVSTLIFSRNWFSPGDLPLTMNPPAFAHSTFVYAYLTFAVFGLFALLILNMRRSTTGLALRAVRDSASASRTLGLSVLQVRVLAGSLAAFVAAIGGGFIAMDPNVAQAVPASFDPIYGLIWLAVVVSFGVRAITGAALAGLMFSVMPGVFATYILPHIPSRFGEAPVALFGLGAVSLALHPEGVVVQNARLIRQGAAQLLVRRAPNLVLAPATFGMAGSGAGPEEVTPGSSATNGNAPLRTSTEVAQ